MLRLHISLACYNALLICYSTSRPIFHAVTQTPTRPMKEESKGRGREERERRWERGRGGKEEKGQGESRRNDENGEDELI